MDLQFCRSILRPFNTNSCKTILNVTTNVRILENKEPDKIEIKTVSDNNVINSQRQDGKYSSVILRDEVKARWFTKAGRVLVAGESTPTNYS